MNKMQVGYRFSEEARSLLVRLASKLGVSQTAILEMAIRKFAEAEGISPEPTEIGSK